MLNVFPVTDFVQLLLIIQAIEMLATNLTIYKTLEWVIYFSSY